MAGLDGTNPNVAFRVFALSNAALLAVLCAAYYATTNGVLDFANHAIGRDFAIMWTAADLVWQGRILEVFDPERLMDAMRGHFGPGFPPHYWSYPPIYLFLVLPFGALPYVPAYIAWCLSTFALFALALRTVSKDRLLLAMLLLAPSTFMVVLLGHNGFVTAALLVAGCALMHRRPVLAGILFGLLTFKPHLGLLVPLLVIARRNWMTFAAAAVTGALLVLASIAAFGIESWQAYFGRAIPQQTLYMAHGSGPFTLMMPTWFMSARLTGLPAGLAYVLQAVATAVVMVVCYRAFRTSRSLDVTLGILGVGAILATPLAFNYDMTVVSLAILLLPPIAANDPWLRHERLVAMLAWTIPWLVIPLGILAHATRAPWALSPVVLAALLAVLIARSRHEAPAGR